MPKINLLPKEISELIAAGEVVERPASVVKELLENSVDAKAKHITLEINRGGILYIRVTDDGVGIAFEDVPVAFLRHATSKIKTQNDLDRISSLGFRGEALAATACVSKIELYTKQKEDIFGTHYKIEGGTEILFEENGCPDGTTVIVRDIFYNTPARMKFLKKDVTEGNSVAAVFERVAMSHPEIAFKLIRDGKTLLSTSGDGKLSSAIYGILGREISSSMIPVGKSDTVSGYVCKPQFCRKSRAVQYTFLNGRYVQSNTVMAACEQAYKNSVMVGKYPAFVLNINIPFDMVDINVHPAKTQVRFADEKRIFDAVYVAVKNAILSGDTRPEVRFTPKNNTAFGKMSTEQYRQEVAKIPNDKAESVTIAEKIYAAPTKTHNENRTDFVFKSDNTPFFERKDVKEYIKKQTAENVDVNIEKTEKEAFCPIEASKQTEPTKTVLTKETEKIPVLEEKPIRYIGEAFSTYIIAEMGDSVYLIDKHAAHERINFNKLKENARAESQQLLLPQNVRLGRDEFNAVIENTELLLSAGFELEDFGNSTVLVRAVPAMLSGEDICDIVVEAAKNLLVKGMPKNEKLDRIYHTVACKAAIKGGNITGDFELEALAKTVLSSDDIMYCPHGRPVAFRLSQKELEKQFGRIQ